MSNSNSELQPELPGPMKDSGDDGGNGKININTDLLHDCYVTIIVLYVF